MENKSSFYLSGLISFSIYILLFSLVLIYVNAPKPKKYDAFSKTTVIELQLVSNKSTEKKVARKSVEKKENVVKKSTSKTNKQKTNLKSLFSDVKTDAKKVTEKVVNKVKASSDPSRFRSKFEKQRKTDNVQVSKLLNDVKSSVNKKLLSSTAKGKTHPYFSKIKEILWQRWNPRSLDIGLTVQVLVSITNDGKFDYRIMKYSNNERFDDALKTFLDTQKNELFPPHKINKKVDIIINFKSEG